jgi:hypothetical protein
MPSESMAELPVKNATMNLMIAMIRLDAIAPYIAMGFLEDSLGINLTRYTFSLCKLYRFWG